VPRRFELEALPPESERAARPRRRSGGEWTSSPAVGAVNEPLAPLEERDRRELGLAYPRRERAHRELVAHVQSETLRDLDQPVQVGATGSHSIERAREPTGDPGVLSRDLDPHDHRRQVHDLRLASANSCHVHDGNFNRRSTARGRTSSIAIGLAESLARPGWRSVRCRPVAARSRPWAGASHRGSR